MLTLAFVKAVPLIEPLKVPPVRAVAHRGLGHGSQGCQARAGCDYGKEKATHHSGDLSQARVGGVNAGEDSGPKQPLVAIGALQRLRRWLGARRTGWHEATDRVLSPSSGVMIRRSSEAWEQMAGATPGQDPGSYYPIFGACERGVAMQTWMSIRVAADHG
jgi:hypothetical protein